MSQHTVVMPKSKKTKLKPRKEVCVRCISCKKRFQALLYANGCVRSAGLSRHLYSSSRRLCFDFYQRNGIFLDVGGKGDFRTSMLPQRTRQDDIPPLSLSLPRYTPESFGLTGAINGPHRNGCRPTKNSSESNKIDHALLNQETLFVGTIPSVCRQNIESLLSVQNNPDDNVASKTMVDLTGINDFSSKEIADGQEDDSITLNSIVDHTQIGDNVEQLSLQDSDDCSHEEEGHNDAENNVDTVDNDNNNVDVPSHPTNSHSIVGDLTQEFGPFSHQFTAEVELSHLLRKHKCNLNLFKPVFEWAIRSQKRIGFDFALLHNSRAHKTILKEVVHCTQSSTKSPDRFSQTTINWMPDNLPVDVCV